MFQQSFLGGRGVYPLATFAAHGYAILRPNPRGSSGYGTEFRRANVKDWGGADYQDLMTGVDKVIAMGVADPERLGVMGWSYGGFMTSWIVTQTQRFKAASAGAPVTNLMSFNGTADIPGVRSRLFWRPVLGRHGHLSKALGDVQRQRREDADDDSARRGRRPRADLAGLRVLQRAESAGRADANACAAAPTARTERTEDAVGSDAGES